jgi:hypothetical protein
VGNAWGREALPQGFPNASDVDSNIERALMCLSGRGRRDGVEGLHGLEWH